MVDKARNPVKDWEYLIPLMFVSPTGVRCGFIVHVYIRNQARMAQCDRQAKKMLSQQKMVQCPCTISVTKAFIMMEGEIEKLRKLKRKQPRH